MSYGQWKWVADSVAENDGHPKMVAEAMKLFGIHEAPGGKDNPLIISWAHETDLTGYSHDETPWCGLFMAVVAKRAGKAIPRAPLWALNWAAFGTPSPEPSFGDVLVFKRSGGGHVGLYVAENANAYFVLGGNEGDAVSIVPIARNRLYACRRPTYSVQPANVLPVKVDIHGALSTNEA